MLIVLLSPFIFSASVQITADNFDDILNNSKQTSVFIKLWAPWCKFCKEMAPEWTKLAQSESLKESVIIAELECQENRELCKKFEGKNYPRIYYIDVKQNLTTRYLGPRTQEHFEIFIEKQLKFPLISVSNTEESLQPYLNLSQNKVATSFVFCFPNKDRDSLELARELAIKHRHYESQFLVIDTNEPNNSMQYFPLKENETKIIAITGPNITKELSCSFDDIRAEQFLYAHSIPFMNEFSPSVMQLTAEEKKAAFIMVTNKRTKTYDEWLMPIFNYANDYYPITMANCIDQQWICLYTSINVNDVEPHYLIFNRNKKLFWLYNNKNKSDESIKQWVTDVYHGKVRSQGPGTGFLSLILEPIYDQRAAGETVSLVPYVVIPLVVLFMISAACIDFCKDVKKMTKESEESLSKNQHRE